MLKFYFRNFTFKRAGSKVPGKSGDSGLGSDDRSRKRLADVVGATVSSLCSTSSMQQSSSGPENTPRIHSEIVRRRLDLS